MLVWDNMIMTHGQFFLQNAAGMPGTMMLLGIVNGRLKKQRKHDMGLFLVGDLTIAVQHTGDGSKATAGYRADQILVRGYDLQQMKPVNIQTAFCGPGRIAAGETAGG